MELWRRIGRRSAALELLGTWDQVAGRVHDRTFEMPHLLGDAQHLFRTQVRVAGFVNEEAQDDF